MNVGEQGLAGPPLVSVVVIGRNEGERLGRCLESVLGMHHEGWTYELMYVDSGSTDGSVALAESLGGAAMRLETQRPTAALARNAGWQQARGEFVLFLDGDTVLAPEFVAASLAEFAESSVGVVWGHRREVHPERSVYNRVLDLDWIYAPGFTPFCGGDALFRRSALVESGGFDDGLIAGEEPELCRRLLGAGWRILHVDRPMTGHDLAIGRFSQYWRRGMRAGHAFAEVAERFAASDASFWSEEVRRNRNRAFALAGAAVVAVFAGAALRSWWPLAGFAAGFALLVGRTAWKARWKSKDAGTLLLYGVHSHLQQIPIFAGQMRYRRDRREGRRSGLLEYKQP